MEINVTEGGLIELKQIYNPIVLISPNNEQFTICMRDGGFEFRYYGRPFRAVKGELEEITEKWHKEFRDDTTWVGTFYDWCIEYKQPKKKDHSNDEDKVGSGN